MRNVLCLALLVPIMASAAGKTQPVTAIAPGVSLQSMTVLPAEGKVLPLEGKVPPSSPQSGLGPSRAARFTIGTVDTVGGTTYDWGANGPAPRMLTQTPGKGVHVLFMYSQRTDTLFTDRNMRYNFYDYSTRAWNWNDPDFMASGVGVFPVPPRTGYGRIDVDTNGVAVISAHHVTTGSLAPLFARDAEVGQGIFDYAYGEPALDHYAWPWVAVNTNGTYQLVMIDYNNKQNLYWTRSTDHGATWDAPVDITSPQPEPNTSDQNIATSKVPGSNKVCITWVAAPLSGYAQEPGFFRESPDAGNNWDTPVDLGFPPAFNPGSETVPSYSVSSLFPLYDRNDNLHIVGSVEPYVRDTNWVKPGQIWHWCAANPDTWNLIRVASPDSWTGNVGYNVSVCSRPSLGQDDRGNLFVVWEEFDGVNVESTTTYLRADIWYSYSTDNGVTWADGTRITDGGDVTYRFPSILDPIGDTVMVEYMIDQVAGFFLYGYGPATNNPIVVQKWENPVPPGVEGPKVAPAGRMEIAANPSPANDRTVISYSLPRSGDVSLVVYDAAGRPVQTLASGRREPGRYTATWDAKNAAAGVYFYTLTSGKASITRKLILAD